MLTPHTLSFSPSHSLPFSHSRSSISNPPLFINFFLHPSFFLNVFLCLPHLYVSSSISVVILLTSSSHLSSFSVTSLFFTLFHLPISPLLIPSCLSHLPRSTPAYPVPLKSSLSIIPSLHSLGLFRVEWERFHRRVLCPFSSFSSSSRPGRPPKRSQSVTSPENPHILPHSVPGLMSPGTFPSSGLTAAAAAAANAAIAEAMKVKKIKLEVMSSYHSNANQHGADGENGDLSSSVGLELPFMMMPHPLIPVSLPPASVSMAMSQMNHLSTIANMAAAAQQQSLPCRMVTSVIKERVPDSPSPAPSLEDGRRPGSHPSSHRSSSVSSSPVRTESSSDRIPIHQNGLSMNQMNQALLGLSPSILPGPKEGDLAHDMSHEAKRMHIDKDDNPMCTPTARDSYERLSLAGQGLPPGFPSPFLFPDGLSSIENLLTNIQGLLKVAIDNARAQEKQVQLEKTELKMELFRERELRETLEKQLAIEQKNRAIIQKRLKKEKKAKRKLQEALVYESKRREQAEHCIKQPSPSESLRSVNG
uniref:Uncharacterized protein n=1 Tax=Hucho hucho TaxID=62062 RepID=A0A4W5LUX1_9TELE